MKKISILLLAGSALLTLGGCQLVWDIMGYQAVMTSPQYAVISHTGSLTFSGISVNGQLWKAEPKYASIRPLLPAKKLRGVRAIIIGQESDTSTQKRGIGGHLYLPESDAGKILFGPFGLSIDDTLKNEYRYPEEIYRTDFKQECPRGKGQSYEGIKMQKVPLIALGKILLKQKYKHLTFSGAFMIPPTEIPRDPYMICPDGKNLIRNPAPPATISIDEIRINIDSPVEYIWASKGGKEYRW